MPPGPAPIIMILKLFSINKIGVKVQKSIFGGLEQYNGMTVYHETKVSNILFCILKGMFSLLQNAFLVILFICVKTMNCMYRDYELHV